VPDAENCVVLPIIEYLAKDAPRAVCSRPSCHQAIRLLVYLEDGSFVGRCCVQRLKDRGTPEQRAYATAALSLLRLYQSTKDRAATVQSYAEASKDARVMAIDQGRLSFALWNYSQHLQKNGSRRKGITEKDLRDALEPFGLASLIPVDYSSPEERALGEYLLPLGFVHSGNSKNHRIGPFYPDWVNVKAGLVVEMDAHPSHFTPEGLDRAKARNNYILGLGWRIQHITGDNLLDEEQLRTRLTGWFYQTKDTAPKRRVTAIGPTQ
jgi:very-short-patch-repair endonuclease